MRNAAFIFVQALTAALILATAIPAYSGGPGAAAAANSISYERPVTGRSMEDRERKRRAVTPYGDFCSRCSKYGMGKRPVSPHEALAAISDYFRHRGLEVKNVQGRGRFLTAEIYKGDRLVDKILFDRRTGRIRSIY